jgi:formylmethanofuran dehydrogenase subunit E
VALDRLTQLHPRLCPRQVLGVRIGLLAGELLGVDLPRDDKRLLAVVETDGCFADGISVVTGCWLGHRTLRLVDYGRVAATIVDTQTGRGVRIRPTSNARVRAVDWAPEAPDRWHAQLVGYQRMPVRELLQADAVWLATSIEKIIGQPGARQTCRACREEILNCREVMSPVGPLCRACATEPYYAFATRAGGTSRAECEAISPNIHELV